VKTLFVVGGLPFGGIENLLLDISKELLRRNFPFKVVNLSGTGQKIQDFEEAEVPLINLGSSLKEIKTFNIKTARKLKRLIEEEGANIVHSMQFSADYFTRVSLFLTRKPKVITHIHSIKVEKRLERKIFNKLLSYRTDAFLSVSKAVYKMVEEEHNVAKKPHYVMYNGIDFKKLEILKNTEIKLPKGKKFFAIVGRLVPMKKVDLAIKALSIIVNKHPEAGLLIIGDGKERKKLERLAKELSLGERVIFTGYKEKVAPYLLKSYALLMPSEYEGLPITHIEAAYFGLPAIISPFVPSREIFSDSSLVSPLSAEEIAKRMEILLENEELYRRMRMSQKAKETAKNYSIERYTDTLIDFYERLIKGKLPKERVLF